MADDLTLSLKAQLDLKDVEAQLNALKNNKDYKLRVAIDANAIKQQLSDVVNSIKSHQAAKLTLDVLKGQSNANINGYVQDIQNRFKSNPIKLAFTVDTKATEANLKNALQNLQNIYQQIAAASKQAQQAQQGQGQQGQQSGYTGNKNIPTNASGVGAELKYYDQLADAVDRYKDAFADANAVVSRWSISDGTRATVEFKNAVGETTTVMFRLEEVMDEITGDTFQEWNAVGDRFTKTFTDSGKDIEKSLDKLQSFQNKLKDVYSKGFERTNQLSGSFATPVENEIDRIQNKIDGLTASVKNNGIAMTSDQVRELTQELKDLDLLRIKQQNTQYQARQLSATDIQSQIPILKNDVAALENQLKSLGFGEKFKDDIKDLRDMLKTLGKDGGATIQQFNSRMKEIKSESNLLKTRPYGQGLMTSQDISKNQLTEIQSINKILNQQVSTAGIQQAKDNVNQLADAYKRLQTQLQSKKISGQRLTDIQRQMGEYDQQLKAYQQLANALNGDRNSQKWVSQQEAGIAQMRSSFEEYRQEISKTIELTPELQNRLNALNTVMNTDGAIDVANWQVINNEFRELKSNIDEFSKSYQGQASQIQLGQLKDVQQLQNMLANIGQQYSGAGVENLRQNLQNLATEYQNVITQLQNPNLSQDEYAQLAQKVQELDEQFKQAANSAKIFSGGIKNDADLRKFEQNAERLRLNFQQLRSTYEDLIKSNPQVADKFNTLNDQINNVDPTNIQEITRAVNTLGKECQVASGQSAGLRGALESAFGGVGSYLARFTSAFFVIRKGIQVVKSMVNEVKSLDSALVSLQKVTGLSGSALQEFTDRAYEAGAALGRTGKDVIDAVATFSRAGYDLNEATALAQSALVMSNVGVDIPNMESAASDMISILKAFDIQAEESMGVIDRLYNVSNKEPLDFGNLTQMLVTAGGTLAQTGTSLNETMALLTSAFATMRDTSVANG